MQRNYTEAVREGFFDLIENDTKDIWKDLDRSVDMIRSGKWKEHYQGIVSKYRFSSRFAFMRILFEEATGLSPAKTDEQALAKGFCVAGIGDFPDITIRHAQQMPEEEVALYRKLLLRRVEENNPDFCREATSLVARAVAAPAEGAKCALRRDEIIRLGHMVNFSLESMQFILLRVLGDNEAGFNHSASGDIIDLYGFINRSPLSQVDALKAWYEENAAAIPKAEYADKPVHFTRDIATAFEQTFLNWAPENREEEFKKWLLQQAPCLDLKSKTARKVYMNLAAYAYIRAKKYHLDHNDIVGDDLYEDMEYLSRVPGYHAYALQLFFKGTKPDAQKCKSVAEGLIYENAEYADNFGMRDNNSELLYHVPYVEKGKITTRGSFNKNSKKRIEDILMDKVAPAKSDLLYLLWIVANCQWVGMDISPEEKPLFLDDFLAAASCLLEAAFLPDFYPPNILEETLMLALVLGDEAEPPATIYEAICSAFTDKGKVKKKVGAKKKSPEEQKQIADYYYSHLSAYPTKTACKKACAAHFGVSKSSVEGFCKKHPQENTEKPS